jgi:2,5-furandicarboxylate decarboxylase 1
MCPISNNELAIYVGETSDLFEFGRAANGRTLPVVVANGLHPAFFMVAGTRFPQEAEEIALAGGLLGEPVRLTRSRAGQWTVPEAAEIVIEGEIDFQQTVPEGPFGEYTGYYGAGSLQPRQSPILRVHSIRSKENPLYQVLITGPTPGYESAHLSPLSKEAMLYAKLSRLYPHVRRVSLGMGRYIAVVQLDTDFPDELVKPLIHEVFVSSVYIKYAILVDLDIDIADPRDVLWAMSTRVDPTKHLLILPDMVMEPLDPSTPGRCSKLGFDARKPNNAGEGFVRARIPGADSIRLDEYFAQ